MRAWRHLVSLFVSHTLANTEKVIFSAPLPINLPDARPGLSDLLLASLSPAQPSLRTLLPVAFPNEKSQQGVEHWYFLSGLASRQRYELRICWAAVVRTRQDEFAEALLTRCKQPTSFWLDTFNVTHVLNTPDLIQGLATYSDLQQEDGASQPAATALLQDISTSLLFLRVRAAADFYTSNSTLMQNPPPVLVDLILDPYLAGIFPSSLLLTAAYIILLAVGSIYISGILWKRIAPTASKKKD